jgi:hypothetical protein
MTGPSWLAAAFAAVMIVTAVYCAGRLAASRLWRRPTEVDADSVHVVMGVAMAGMLLPGLSALPARAWEAVFMAAALWFAYQAARSRLRQNALSQWRCSDPVPHLVESAAMVYMLAALPGSWPGGPGGAMAMPGMGAAVPAAGGSLSALAVILALFMIGYVFWTADRLTSMLRATIAATSGAVRDKSRALVTVGAPPLAGDKHGPAGASEADVEARSHRPGGAALAPGLAACYKIAMGITMGYMLVLML